MPRNLLQDMKKPSAPQRMSPVRNNFASMTSPARVEKSVPDEPRRNSRRPRYRIYFVALVSVVFLLFALSYLFSGAKVTIVPKVKEISLNENISAAKDANVAGLSFDLVSISGEESKIAQGGEEKDVTIAAKGTAIIYNSYSSSTQVLDIDTRLEGSNGKIYKTSKKITVPGMAGSDKPGSVEVGIYAAVGGEEYNSGPIDFKILGFKGTAKYSKFYGRAKGDITGGFKGKSPVLSSLDKATASSELKAALETKLLKKVTDQVPKGFVLFEDAVFIDIDEKNATFVSDSEGKITATVRGTLYGFLFDEKKLAKKIAESVVEKYDGSEVYIPNIRGLDFSLSDKESISFADVKSVSFSLSGVPRIIWKVDENKFISDILNKKKADFNQVLAQYANIDSAELVIRPFWKTNFPEQSKDIQIIVNYPE